MQKRYVSPPWQQSSPSHVSVFTITGTEGHREPRRERGASQDPVRNSSELHHGKPNDCPD